MCIPIPVTIICPQLSSGGAERQLAYLCQHIDRSRFHVTVIYYETFGEPGEQIRASRVSVVHLDRNRLGTAGLVQSLRSHLRSSRPRVLVCRLPSAYRIGRIAAFGLGIPAIIAEERVALGDTDRRFLDRLLNPWTTCWTGNSTSVCQQLMRRFRLSAGQVRLIWNGIDLSRFENVQTHPIIRELAEQGCRIVVNVGRLEPQKNQELFLRVAAKLCDDFDNLAFIICGHGSLRPQLELLAAQLGLRRCQFLGFQPDIPSILAGADLFVQTSDFEGMPNALMEAMASRVPVVATEVDGTKEIIETGIDGLLVAPGDVSHAVTAAASVLRNPRFARELGHAGRNTIQECFSVQRMVRAYEELFEQVSGLEQNR